MAINLQKIKQPFKGQSASWSDFYLNMALEMAENVAKSKLPKIFENKGLLDFTGDAESVVNITENYFFAQSLTEEYDKVVRGGKTIIGGVPVSFGNTIGMQAALIRILGSTKLNKNGDLLRDIGPAIQAYWLGANLQKFPPPKQPCIGAVLNTSTTLGVNFSPGIWTPISIPPMNSVSPWLLNFIISASVHLLTVGGIFTCICQYPPPAPPAPGVLPWVGYFIKPFSGSPIASLDFKDMVELAAGTVLSPALDVVAGEKLDLSASKLSTQLLKGFVEGGNFQEPQIQAALNSIISGDEPAMVDAGNKIRNIGG